MLNIYMEPRTYRGSLALKKLYNKCKGVEGVTSPLCAHSHRGLLLLKVSTSLFDWIVHHTAGGRGAGIAAAILRDAKKVATERPLQRGVRTKPR